MLTLPRTNLIDFLTLTRSRVKRSRPIVNEITVDMYTKADNALKIMRGVLNIIDAFVKSSKDNNAAYVDEDEQHSEDRR